MTGKKDTEKIAFNGRSIQVPGSYVSPIDKNGNIVKPPEREISMNKRTQHLTVEILDALRLPDTELCELLRTGDGKKMHADDMRVEMVRLLRNGLDTVPACDNHDEKGQCLGHNKNHENKKSTRYWLVSKFIPSVLGAPRGFTDIKPLPGFIRCQNMTSMEIANTKDAGSRSGHRATSDRRGVTI